MLHRPAGKLVRTLFGVGLAIFIGSAPIEAQVTQPGGPVQLGSTQFIRGDANADGVLNIADGIKILATLFQSDPIDCQASGDVNDDSVLNIADAISVFAFLFQGSAPPAPPFPDCGLDPTPPTTPSTLTCVTFDICATTTDRATAAHILRRIAYGPTPTELADLEAIGAEAYIFEQLDPFSIVENPVIDTKIAAIPIASNYTNYARHVMLRGIYSNRQLLEQLTDFWSNHFNTYYWTFRQYLIGLDGGGTFNGTTSLSPAMFQEAIEDELFRQNALGTFENLLALSATSPTMLVYLDNISNVVGNTNENYAREILELHTVGVNGGYSQGDIEQLARCFTGWTVHKVAVANYGDPFAPSIPNSDPNGIWSFKFDAGTHDYGAKSLFSSMGIPLNIPARPALSADGVFDGIEVIQHLAASSLTAEYVSFKLIQKFVNDVPPPALVAQCIGTWLGSGGDLSDVMETILLSPDFLGTAHRYAKIKTPAEVLISTVRMLEGESTNGNQLRNYVGVLQHTPLYFGTPDGYPELGDDWLGTSKLVDTIHFNEIIYTGSGTLNYNPRTIQQGAGVDESDVNAVVSFWFELMFPAGYSVIDTEIAVAFLESNDQEVPTALNPAIADYDTRLRKFLTFLRSWPQAMKQ